MELHFLGGISACNPDGSAVHFPTRKSEALLALMILSPELTLSRGRAAELLWGDRAEEQARASLRQELSNLKKLCVESGCDVIEADRRSLHLKPGQLSVDVLRFRELAASDATEDLAAAATLYSGPLLDGFDAHAPAFDNWLRLERQNLHSLATRVLSNLVQAQLLVGDGDAACQNAERLVGLDPLSESGHRLLMRALDAAGNRSAALAQFDVLASLLSEDLGVEPSQETVDLRARIIAPEKPAGVMVMPSAAAVSHTLFEGRPALAVLPFRTLSKGEDDVFFAGGMTEDVMAGLSSWRWFPVIGTNTTSHYRDHPGGLSALCSESGARYVLDGSIRRSGNALRVGVELTDAKTGVQLWSRRFDRQLEDVFAIQDEISEQIIRRIEPELSNAESQRILRKRPDDLTTWELIHKARAIKYRSGLAYGTRADTNTAFELLRTAVKRDPMSSFAHSDLARCHWHSIICAWTDDPVLARERAIVRSQRAIELDDGSWEAFGIQGLIQIFGLHDISAGIESQRRAVHLNPSASLAHHFLACGLEFAGQMEEALEHLQIAAELDPRSRGASVFLANFSSCNLLLGNFEAAIDYGRKSIGLDQNYIRGRQRLIAALSENGDLSEANNELRTLRKQQPGISLEYLGRTYPFRRPEHLEVFVRAFRRLGVQ